MHAYKPAKKTGCAQQQSVSRNKLKINTYNSGAQTNTMQTES